MIFNNYAKYYNLLYKDKEYGVEVNHVHNLIELFSKQPAKNILDIGCGTGTHAGYLANTGYKITGIDLSIEMVNQAIAREIPDASFYVGDATDFKLDNEFDVITSLFHVFSYQTSNKSAEAMIKNACNHLKNNGLFIFDFWYGPAVLSEKPTVKIKRLEDDEIKVTRIAEPILKVNDNIVDVNFELMIYDKVRNLTETINEVHPMRYFFKPEIELFMAKMNMGLIYFKEWLTGQTPSDTTWSVCCVAIKN